MAKHVSKKERSRRKYGEPSAEDSQGGQGSSLILLSFFLSGSAALVYEVLWVRLITLFSGHTTVATSAVLAAFMAGLALGAFLGGRAADRLSPAQLLKLYGGLELSIGLTGLLSKPAIDAMGALVVGLGALTLAPALQSLTYFVLSFVVLLLPTTLMGATLPVLTRWRSLRLRSGDRAFPAPPSSPSGEPVQGAPPPVSPGSAASTMRGEAADRSLPLLYGLNTLGAVVGTTVAGFAILPAFGLTKSLLCAAAVNSLAAAFAFAVGENAPSKTSRSGPREVGQPILWRPALLLGLTGAAAMISEVAWTRAFALLLGSTVYAFTVMLATFLLGLACGSLAFHRLCTRHRPGYSGLGILLAGIALSVYAGLPFFDRLPYVFMRLHAFAALKTDVLYLVQFALCALVMIVPTFLMGAVFPWAVAASRPQQASIGHHTGTYYAANTVGAIVGSATAGLILLPMLDVERSLLVAVWIYAVAALTAVGGAPVATNGRFWGRRAAAAAATVLLVTGTWLRPVWSERLVASGMFLYASHYGSIKDYKSFLEEMARDKVLFHRSGRNATVSVLESSSGSRYMRINGKTDASEGKDLGPFLLVGYLPLLLHPAEPHRILAVGLGSGATAAAVASDPLVQQIDVIEIEPVVAEAARFFSRTNRDVLEDPRVRLHFVDARQFVAAGGEPYDLILSQPSNPWIVGIASLYTQEAFESAKSRLAEDGVFCQWLQGYQLSEDDFRMILRTFTSVFPHTMLMYYGQGDYFLMGSKAPWRIDYPDLEAAFRENQTLREDLSPLDPGIDHPLRLLAWTFVLTDAELRTYTLGRPLHTDDHPTLEFTAPRYFHKERSRAILERLGKVKKRMLPDGLYGLEDSDREKAILMDLAGQALLRSNEVDKAEGTFQEALKLDPESARTWTHAGMLHERRGEDDKALAAYRKAAALDPRYPEGRRQLGKFYAERGRVNEGLRELEEALRLAPEDPQASLAVGQIYMVNGRQADAARVVRAALRRPVPDEGLRQKLVSVLRQAEGPGGSSADRPEERVLRIDRRPTEILQ